MTALYIILNGEIHIQGQKSRINETRLLEFWNSWPNFDLNTTEWTVPPTQRLGATQKFEGASHISIKHDRKLSQAYRFSRQFAMQLWLYIHRNFETSNAWVMEFAIFKSMKITNTTVLFFRSWNLRGLKKKLFF